jgi:hypothetical protein
VSVTNGRDEGGQRRTCSKSTDRPVSSSISQGASRGRRGLFERWQSRKNWGIDKSSGMAGRLAYGEWNPVTCVIGDDMDRRDRGGNVGRTLLDMIVSSGCFYFLILSMFLYIML